MVPPMLCFQNQNFRDRIIEFLLKSSILSPLPWRFICFCIHSCRTASGSIECNDLVCHFLIGFVAARLHLTKEAPSFT